MMVSNNIVIMTLCLPKVYNLEIRNKEEGREEMEFRITLISFSFLPLFWKESTANTWR